MAKAKVTKQTYLDWYELMLRIRRFEEKAGQMYGMQKIRGFCHLYIGQEAVAAGTISATNWDDPIITAYRDHGWALARGISCNAAMAELFGKATGCTKGKGGSMHYFSKEGNLYGGHGIVGGQIGIGAGIALAEQYKGTKNVCLTIFGDGAARQGILHESFNMAMKWKLPVVFMVENNGYAMGTSVERTSNVTELHTMADAYDMPHYSFDGMSCEETHKAIFKAMEHARGGNGPIFIEAITYRYKGHSMSDPAKYRTKDELNEYKDQDPIETIKKTILEKKYADEAWFEEMSTKIKTEVEESVNFAEESPLPELSELYQDNYAQADYPYIMD